MPRLSPIVNFDRPDGTLGSLFVGASHSVSVDEAAIRTAVALAREQHGTDIRISFIDDDGRCRHRVSVK